MQVNIHETNNKLVLMHELKKCYAVIIIMVVPFINPLSAGDAFKRIHTVFSQLKFDRN